MAQNEKTYQVRFTLEQLEDLYNILRFMDGESLRKYEDEKKRFPDRIIANKSHMDKYIKEENQEQVNYHRDEEQNLIASLDKSQQDWVKASDLRWHIGEKLTDIDNKS